MKIIFADVECNGLLEEATKLHCVTFREQGGELETTNDPDRIREMFTNEDHLFVMHNGIGYDKPVLEKLLYFDVTSDIVDTLFLCWYLYPNVYAPGLATWGDKFGFPKVAISDWENGSFETYKGRCERDVEIQEQLWNKLDRDLTRLYADEELKWHCIRHITFKARCAALAEKSRWKLDRPNALRLLRNLTAKYETAVERLKAEMPLVAKKATKTRPTKQYKKDFSTTKQWDKWVELVKREYGGDPLEIDSIDYVASYEEPNPGSPSQIKDWLWSLGWHTETFKYVRNKETDEVRKIPQIKVAATGMLCDSVERMISDNPCLEVLRDLSVVKHRIGVVKGLIENCSEDGFVKAGVQGLTNTLRFKHRVCVNLPTCRKPYGTEIRSLLTAKDDEHEICGSDMVSLEDRTKRHFMWKHDPAYVADMSADDFDPHLDMGVQAGMITKSDVEAYKAGTTNHNQREWIISVRTAAKAVNYSATYGAGPKTISRAANISLKRAEQLHATYWKRNWAIKAIAEECSTKEAIGGEWLWNPVAKLWLSLRSEKDRFSTLNQSTGTYCFDRWVHHLLRVRPQITAQFHDEVVLEVVKGYRRAAEGILRGAINAVNEELQLNCQLDCDVKFSTNYAGVH